MNTYQCVCGNASITSEDVIKMEIYYCNNNNNNKNVKGGQQ